MTEQQGVHDETVAESQGPEEQHSDQQINWRAAQETMAEQKRQMEFLREQNNVLLQRWNENKQTGSQPQEADPFNGMNPDDVLTVAEFKSAFQRSLDAEKQSLKSELDETRQMLKRLDMRTKHSDFEDAIQSAWEELKNDPALAEAVASSKNPQLLAYRLAKKGTEQNTRKQAEAAKMLENAAKPKSVSQASTGGSAMSAVHAINNMSDEEFNRHISQIKRGLG